MIPDEDPPDRPVRPDVDKIRALIYVWDHRCPAPHDCPHRYTPQGGGLTRFFRRIGRSPQSFWNFSAPGRLIGPGFITQIAHTLHVSWRDITLPAGETAGAEDPQPQAEAA